MAAAARFSPWTLRSPDPRKQTHRRQSTPSSLPKGSSRARRQRTALRVAAKPVSTPLPGFAQHHAITQSKPSGCGLTENRSIANCLHWFETLLFSIMKPPWIAAVLTFATTAFSQTFIPSGHVDIGIGYESSVFDLHVHRAEPVDQEFTPGEAVFAIGPASAGVSPGGAFTGFLGAAGTPVWVLRTTENEQLPFLGFGTEELTASDWQGNISLSLKSVSGPGAFSVWGVGGFGAPDLKMSTVDGITAGDRLLLVPGSHGHFNVGFSAPGDYLVTLEASGTHLIDGLRTSDPATYRFQVIPEPSTWALGLAGAGFGALALHRRWAGRRRP